MSKRLTRGWLVRAGIASAMGAAAIIVAVTMGSGSTVQAAPPDMNQAVSPAAQNQTVLGSNFTVNINVTNINNVTWAGFSMELTYNPAILLLIGQPSPGNVGPGCTGGSYSPVVQPAGTVLTGCFGQTATGQSPPPSDIITFQCVGQGTSPLHLKTVAEDPVNGSTFFNSGSVNIPTSQTDGAVTCQLPITKSHAGGATLTAGTNVVYTVHVGNPTAFSIPGNVIKDTVPAAVTVTAVTSTNGALDGCGFVGNVVTCATATINSPGGLDVLITASIPLSAAGTGPICNSAQLNPPTGPTSNSDCFNVAPSSLTISKVADAASYLAGATIGWTLTLTSNGPSPATGVTVNDTATAGYVITGSSVFSGTCAANPTTATNATFSGGTMTTGQTCVLKVTGTVNASVPGDQKCRNDASASKTNPAATVNATQATADCKPPFVVVEFNKSTDTDVFTNPVGENLWLCSGPTCTANGMGFLNINEIIVPATVAGSDPQGVGAFEFQVKYDNHIFDIQICEGSVGPTAGVCPPIVVGSAAHWLYSTGRIPGAAGIGGCAATIITENDIRFGCVSKNPTTGATGCLGPDNVTMVPTAQCGVNSAGVAAVIHVTPKPDLSSRITPGNDNGAIRTLLDEACEVADIWGHPLSAAIGAFPGGWQASHSYANPAYVFEAGHFWSINGGVSGATKPNFAAGIGGTVSDNLSTWTDLGITFNGYDTLGREIPLPGILPGGLVKACKDLTITVRVLEGDMNKDCVVDISDDQLEASHYGAFFGTLLYQPWFDLEPALKDGDVDIKDLQKVFGRNGSTCTNPIPPQPPLPDPDP